MTDPYGRQLNFFVDAGARVTKLVDPAGQAIQYFYDEASSYVAPGSQPGNNLTSVQYPDGYVRRYHYNEPAYTASAELSKALTGVSELIPPASQFTRFSIFTYDAQGRARTTERAGSTQRYSMAYGSGQVSVTDPLGTVRTHNFTTLLNVSRRVSTQQPPRAGSSACSDTRTYDNQANVTSNVDFNGNKSCYVNDTARRLETKRVEGLAATADCAAALSNPPTGARVITTEWHPYWRFQTRIAEPKLVTTRSYNDNGSTCAPADALVDDRPIAVVCSRSEQATTDDSGAAGFSAAPTGADRTWSYTYNPWGQVLTEDGPRTDIADTTAYEYYPDTQADWTMGDLKQITNAAGHITRFTKYNRHGQVLERIDANGLITTYTYNLRQRLTSVTEGSEQTRYDYDPVGNLTQVTLPDGATVAYTYDAAHRLVAVNDHKGNRIAYTLDAMGNRVGEQAKDAGGQLVRNVSRVIDALNRVQQLTGVPETDNPAIQ